MNRATHISILNALGHGSWRQHPARVDPHVVTDIPCGFNSFVCFAEDDPPDDDPPEDKVYSKADVERMVKTRVKTLTQERDKAVKAREKLQATVDKMDAEFQTKLEKAVEGGASQAAAELAKLQTAHKKLQGKLDRAIEERDEAKGLYETTSKKMKSGELYRRVNNAFLKAGGFAKSAKHGVAAFIADSDASLDYEEDGSVSITATVGGTPFDADELDKAVGRWLQDAPHFAAAPKGTPSGGSRPGGAPQFTKEGIDDMSIGEAISTGLSTPVDEKAFKSTDKPG